MTRWTFLFTGLLFFVAATLVVVSRLGDHDLSTRQSEPFVFWSDDNQLEGTLWFPDVPVEAVIVLVHGDGPQDRTSEDGYPTFINAMLDAGIAVASWDKPGIGGSTGNWLSQSMDDRAAEVATALQVLKERFDGQKTGALGFSQAGWVLPKLTSNEADFIVLVGPAVSWQQQGAYYTRRRLERSGAALDATAIDVILTQQEEQNSRLFGPGSSYDLAMVPDGMSEERWGFIQRNRLADATVDLQQLSTPLLSVWGANDLNVDALHDAAAYEFALDDGHPATRLHVLPDATHGLLKAGPYNYQLVSQWSWYAQLRFLWEGRRAYAPGALDLITEWIRAR